MKKILPAQFKSVFTLYYFLAIITGIFLLLTVQRALAQESRTFTVSPPTTDHSLDPGGKSEGSIKLINDSSEPLTFDVTIQDFIVEHTDGTPTILPPDTLSNKYSASSWIAVYPQQVTVAPQTREELSYFIQVPADASAGGHYAAVVFTPSNAEAVDGSGALVQTQIGTLFSIGVSGVINEGATVTQFGTAGFQENGPVTIQTLIQNNGDLHIRPEGSITVTDTFGRLVDTQQLHQNNVFPGAEREYTNTFGEKFMIGKYTAKLEAKYGRANDKVLMATASFWVLPWKIMTVAALSIIVVILLIILERKKLKKHHSEPQS